MVSHIGEDNIVIGSDYGHQDPSEERQMEQAVRGRGDLSPGRSGQDPLRERSPPVFIAVRVDGPLEHDGCAVQQWLAEEASWTT